MRKETGKNTRRNIIKRKTVINEHKTKIKVSIIKFFFLGVNVI